MSTNRLFKYVSPEAVIRILEDQAFKFSSPFAFNDPFDMQLDDIFGYNENEFEVDFVVTFAKKLLNNEIDKNSDILLPGLVELLKRLPKEEMEGILNNMQCKSNPIWGTDTVEKFRIKYISMIQPLINSYGIFCGSLKHNNIVMWTHYSKNHEGAVLEITPNYENNSKFLISKPVLYSDTRSALIKSPEDFFNMISKSDNEKAKYFLDAFTFSKGKSWEYEEEIRLAIPNIVPEGSTCAFLKFYPNELTRIYLGCRISDENQNKIIRLANILNPFIKIYKAQRHKNSYILDFLEFK